MNQENTLKYEHTGPVITNDPEVIQKIVDCVGAPLADTGNRTDMGTGALRDMGGDKGRCDLLPATALLRMYKTPNVRDYMGPVLVNEYFIRYLDGDSKIDHLAHIAYWALWCMNLDGRNNTSEFDEHLCPEGLLRLARHYENGAKKYADRNWEKGLPISSFIDSGYRHFLKWLMGWTDEDHLAAIAWNVLGAMWTEEKYPELQDLPSRITKLSESESNHE